MKLKLKNSILLLVLSFSMIITSCIFCTDAKVLDDNSYYGISQPESPTIDFVEISLGNWLTISPQVTRIIIIIGSSILGSIIIALIPVIIAKIIQKTRKDITKGEEKKEAEELEKTVNIHTTLRVVELIGTIEEEGEKLIFRTEEGLFDLHTIAPWQSQDTLKDSEELRENIGQTVEIFGDSDGIAIWNARVNRTII